MRKPRLADVAARAGVSRTTASYILNGRADEMRISVETVGRVREAVTALGYRPNSTARSLRTAETRTVGLISDHVASGHFASLMLTGASAAARELDHLLVIGETDGDPLLEQALVDQMLDRGVDGVVYATLRHREVTVPRALVPGRTVLLNCLDAAGRLPAVVPDERGGGRIAAGLLLGEPDDIVVVGDDKEQGTRAGELRLAGVVERLAEAGREVAAVVPCAWSVTGARDALTTWWRSGGRAAAIVCMNDRVAMGVYQALETQRMGVPADVAVVSFDGSELGAWLRPAVASVGLPFADLGAAAVRAVLDDLVTGVVELPMSVSAGGSVPSLGTGGQPAGAPARSAVRRTASANAGYRAPGRS